jgi:hypothetical protein
MKLLDRIRAARAQSLATALSPGERTATGWAKLWRCDDKTAYIHLERAVALGLMTKRRVKVTGLCKLVRAAMAYREIKGGASRGVRRRPS